MTALDFWYEFGSTYSYPAAMRIERLAEAAHVEVRWRPFLLGPIFKAYGWNDSPFNIYSAKGRYMWRDLQRICEAEGLPLKLPPVQFPQNGLKAARLALVGERQGWTPAFSRAVFVANYAEQKDISDKETLVARLISKYDLLAVPVVDKRDHVLGIVTVDDIIDAMIEGTTEDVQRFGGVEALDAPYMDIGFVRMIQKRAGWLCALFLGEMLTASAMQHFQSELEKAVVLTLFIPLIMSSGGNSGSQATSLIIRAVALQEVRLRDWWRVALRELPTGVTLGAILGVIGMVRIALWQNLGVFDYGEHWVLVAFTVGAALVGIVTFGSLAGSMLPFILKRIGFDPASASAPFVATLVDVTGLVIYFSIALVFLRGTLR